MTNKLFILTTFSDSNSDDFIVVIRMDGHLIHRMRFSCRLMQPSHHSCIFASHRTKLSRWV